MKLEIRVSEDDKKSIELLGQYSYLDVHSFNIEQIRGKIRLITFFEEVKELDESNVV